MNRSIFALLIAATMGCGVALADDTPNTPPPTSTPNTATGDETPQKLDQKQFMKECMGRK